MNADQTVGGSIGKLEKKHVIVTGGGGRIGGVVVRDLLEHGHQVTILDRRMQKETPCKFVFTDLRDRAHVQPAMESAEVLVHIGELPGPWGAATFEQVYSENAAAGSTVMQTAADLKYKRIVYISSCQVYGFAFGFWGEYFGVPQHLPFDETHPVNPTNPYSAGKVANEAFAKMLAVSRNLSVATIRFPWVINMPDPNHHVWKDALSNRHRPADGVGSYLQVSDAASAVRMAMENPRPGYEAYHVAAEDTVYGGTVQELIKEQFPGYPSLPADWPAYKSVVNCQKMYDHFGWKPKFAIRQILAQQAAPAAKP